MLVSSSRSVIGIEGVLCLLIKTKIVVHLFLRDRMRLILFSRHGENVFVLSLCPPQQSNPTPLLPRPVLATAPLQVQVSIQR